MSFAGFVGSLEPTQDDEIAEMLLMQLRAVRSYARVRRRAVQRFTVSEVCSPPSIKNEIEDGKWKHLVPGFALDLTVVDPSDGLRWDFSRKSKREKATALLRLQKPYMLIGSPACKAFSTWQIRKGLRGLLAPPPRSC